MEFITPLFLLALFGNILTYGDDMQDSIRRMDAAERVANKAAQTEVLEFMSIDVMFPDESVRALAKAAGKGDVKKIDQLVKEGANVNGLGTQGVTPLYWAMRNYKGFNRLLELGANPNLPIGKERDSVVHVSVVAKDKRFLSAVLKHGGNPNLTEWQAGNTPIYNALNDGWNTVETLLNAGADINVKNYSGETPVNIAAGSRQFEIVYKLLERGADYKIRDHASYDLVGNIARVADSVRPDTDTAKWMIKVIEWLQAKGMTIRPSTLRIYDQMKANAR